MENLNKEAIANLIKQSDDTWYNTHKDNDYRGHLKFQAEYIVSHYQREVRMLGKRVRTQSQKPVRRAESQILGR